MDGAFPGLVFGFVIGFLGGVVYVVDGNEKINGVYDAVRECQSTLPRNQTCKYVITAVPEVAE